MDRSLLCRQFIVDSTNDTYISSAVCYPFPTVCTSISMILFFSVLQLRTCGVSRVIFVLCHLLIILGSMFAGTSAMQDNLASMTLTYLEIIDT